MGRFDSIYRMCYTMGARSKVVTDQYLEEKSFEYNTNEVPIARDEYENVYKIDFDESQRLLLIGTTGSGKTFFMRGIINRYTKAGYDVIILTDMKPEYHFSKEPIGEPFKSRLLEHEKPEGFPMKQYYPYFFTKVLDMSYEDNITCQLSFKDINEFDFLTALGDYDAQEIRNFIQTVWEEFETGERKDYASLYKLLETDKILDKGAKKRIFGKIQLLEKAGIIGDEFSSFDFVKDIEEGQIPCLNLAGYDQLGKYIGFPSTFIAVIIRKIKQAKREGRLDKDRRLLIVIDEMNLFCPANGEPASKKEILELYYRGRSAGISILASTQIWDSVPDDVFTQSSYLFIPQGFDGETAKKILGRALPAEYTNRFTRGDEIRQKLGEMRRNEKTKERHWLVIDKDKQEHTIINPLPPLSKHPTFV